LRRIKILKIGGSIITDKSPGVFDVALKERIKEVAKEIASNPENLVLVHGVGSFGHPYVEKYRLKERKNLRGVIETHLACKRLNTMVCEALLAEGVNATPIHPFSAFRVAEGLEFDADFILSLLDNGMLPVLHGDMVYNRLRNSFDVVSGDRIVSEFAEALEVERIGFATDIDGIFVGDELIEEVNDENLSEVLNSLGEAESKSDVTGGMRGKVLSMLRIPAIVFIFSGLKSGNITKFLKGERVGTRLNLNC